MDHETLRSEADIAAVAGFFEDKLHEEAQEIVQGMHEVSEVSLEDIAKTAREMAALEADNADPYWVHIALYEHIAKVAESGEY